MRILVINADCIQTNTSANLCHISYIKGMIDLGYDVSLLSVDESDYTIDDSIVIPPEVNSIKIKSISLYEKLSNKLIRKSEGTITIPAKTKKDEESVDPEKPKKLARLVYVIKKKILALYGVYNIYAPFIKKSQKFKSKLVYDYVISLSSPDASHMAAYRLIKSKKVKSKCWIQLWEDPWYKDAYGLNDNIKVYNEEKKLLKYAEHVCYVSPLTMNIQRELYPESAYKMYWQPLPYYYSNSANNEINSQKKSYGYFGDYAPESRNLEPFYTAAKYEGIIVNICGRPYGLFDSTDKISIFPRLSLKELLPIENKTNVLVFLCNKIFGQIPGKIYQYSATYKTILFILDGTDEEKKVLKEYFSKFNRFVFCENTVEDIKRAIRDIENGDLHGAVNRPLDDFEPKKIIENILSFKNG